MTTTIATRTTDLAHARFAAASARLRQRLLMDDHCIPCPLRLGGTCLGGWVARDWDDQPTTCFGDCQDDWHAEYEAIDDSDETYHRLLGQ